MAGIRRYATNPQRKHAATLTMLREFLAQVPNDVRSLCDRTLLLVGFAGVLLRSELASILRRDLDTAPHRGYEVTLKRTKGKQRDAVLGPLPYGRAECTRRPDAR
jgi:hypothetical protein